MAKKLTVNAVNSAAKNTYKMKKHHLTDINGEVWDVVVDEKMNPVKINDVARDILVLVAKLQDEGALEEFDLENQYIALLYPMIIRHYTDLDITDKNTAVETINSYVNLMNNLISLGLLEQLIGCFDEEALANVFNGFKESTEKMTEHIIDEIKRINEENETLEEAE